MSDIRRATHRAGSQIRTVPRDAPARPGYAGALYDFENPEVATLSRTVGQSAACRGKVEYFKVLAFTGKGRHDQRTRIAVDTCLGCPVLNECARLADILQPTAGIWAARLHSVKHPEGLPL